jgi:hypothetical protein
MTGLMVTWDEKEIQAIDEGDFEETVVNVIDDFFDTVDGHREVAVEWKTPTRDHGCVYRVSRPPLIHLDRSRCFIDIVGEQRDGKYQLDMSPSGFEIKTKSSGYTEKITFLRLRGPGVAINTEDQEVLLENIPESVRKRLIDPIRDNL